MKRVRTIAGMTGIVTAGLLGLGTGTAFAATPPPWNDTSATAGGVVPETATGAALSTGDINNFPTFPRTVGTVASTRSGDTKATLEVCTPNASQPDASQWACVALSPSTTYDPTSADPTAVSGTLDYSLGEYLAGDAGKPSSVTVSTGAYAGLYQLRLLTSGNGIGVATSYYQAEIQVTTNGTTTNSFGETVPAGTWSLAYPDAVVPTPPGNPGTNLPEAPAAALLPMAAFAAAGASMVVRRRKSARV